MFSAASSNEPVNDLRQHEEPRFTLRSVPRTFPELPSRLNDAQPSIGDLRARGEQSKERGRHSRYQTGPVSATCGPVVE